MSRNTVSVFIFPLHLLLSTAFADDCPRLSKCYEGVSAEQLSHLQEMLSPQRQREEVPFGSNFDLINSRIDRYRERVNTLADTKVPGALTYQVLNIFDGIWTEFRYEPNIDLETAFRKILKGSRLSEEQKAALTKIWKNFDPGKHPYTGNRLDPQGRLIKPTRENEGSGFADGLPFQFVKPLGENGISEEQFGRFLASFLGRKPATESASEPVSIGPTVATTSTVSAASPGRPTPSRAHALAATAPAVTAPAVTAPAATAPAATAPAATIESAPNASAVMTEEDRREIARMDREARERRERYEQQRRDIERDTWTSSLQEVQSERETLQRRLSQARTRIRDISNEPMWAFIPGAQLFMLEQMRDLTAATQELERLEFQMEMLSAQESRILQHLNNIR